MGKKQKDGDLIGGRIDVLTSAPQSTTDDEVLAPEQLVSPPYDRYLTDADRETLDEWRGRMEKAGPADEARDPKGEWSDTDTPTTGMRFLHSRQIKSVPGVKAKDSPHEECVVTKVARGMVYFRNSTGYLSKTPVEKFHESVGRVIKD